MSSLVGVREVSGKLKRMLGSFQGREKTELLMEGGKVYERGAKQRITEQGLVDTGNLRAKVSADPSVDGVDVGPRGVVYAAIHEFGGVTRPTVTPKMRGFAWWRFRQTGDPMWRAIALTKKTHLTVRIPARPYMRPTFDEDSGAAERAIQRAAEARLQRMFGG